MVRGQQTAGVIGKSHLLGYGVQCGIQCVIEVVGVHVQLQRAVLFAVVCRRLTFHGLMNDYIVAAVDGHLGKHAGMRCEWQHGDGYRTGKVNGAQAARLVVSYIIYHHREFGCVRWRVRA